MSISKKKLTKWLRRNEHPVDFDPIVPLKRDSAVSIDRIRYYATADESVIRGIRRGILFVMAWWSGSSKQAFRELTRTIARIDLNGELELVVVDTDGCPELYHLAEFTGKLSGNGEVAWINEGQIVATSGNGFNPSCFEAHTRALLE